MQYFDEEWCRTIVATSVDAPDPLEKSDEELVQVLTPHTLLRCSVYTSSTSPSGAEDRHSRSCTVEESARAADDFPDSAQIRPCPVPVLVCFATKREMRACRAPAATVPGPQTEKSSFHLPQIIIPRSEAIHLHNLGKGSEKLYSGPSNHDSARFARFMFIAPNARIKRAFKVG